MFTKYFCIKLSHSRHFNQQQFLQKQIFFFHLSNQDDNMLSGAYIYIYIYIYKPIKKANIIQGVLKINIKLGWQRFFKRNPSTIANKCKIVKCLSNSIKLFKLKTCILFKCIDYNESRWISYLLWRLNQNVYWEGF